MGEQVSPAAVDAVGAVLADGREHTAEQVALAAEMSLSAARRALNRLREDGFAQYREGVGRRPGMWRRLDWQAD